VAIKILDKESLASLPNNQGVTSLVNEIRVHWAIFECDGVLQLLEIFEDSEFVYLVLEYQRKGSLLKHLMEKKTMSEKHARLIMA